MPRMRASALIFLSAVLVTASLAVPGCGGDEEPKEEEKQGKSITCGTLMCDPVLLPAGYPPIEACCAANGQCGLDGTQFEQYGAHFTEACQPLDQPGELDPEECDASPPVPTDQFGDLVFPGCCTAAGRCGYMMDTAFTIIRLGLGCVDAEPFLDAGVPPSCTPGPAGGGGAGGGTGQ
ncbi:MAG TPA: hypothetical protein VMS65_01340 [Polyangiaceae bacterium]|nr:hypothetical protein [Polyangiaceae bacterium]